MGYQESYVTESNFERLVKSIQELGESFFDDRLIEPVRIITLKRDITADLSMKCEEGTEYVKAGGRFVYVVGERSGQRSPARMFGAKAREGMRSYPTECFPSEEIFKGVGRIEDGKLENEYAIHEKFPWNCESAKEEMGWAGFPQIMNVKVYQMKDGEKYHGCRFRELLEDVNEVDLRDYDLVYDGELEVQGADCNDIKALDYLYHKLNVGEKPISYQGNSLSVSDLVSLDDRLYCCQSYGWMCVRAVEMLSDCQHRGDGECCQRDPSGSSTV